MLRYDTTGFVLLDMGIVFDLGDISLTPTPYIMGTVGYHSPEQLFYEGRRSLDFRSDLFSLGVVLYEASTGINPFTCNCANKEQIISNTLRLNPQRPSLIRDEIPDSLNEIILRMLSKQPHLRYNSCDELMNRLRSI
jgi:serine/threonine protein kinase